MQIRRGMFFVNLKLMHLPGLIITGWQVHQKVSGISSKKSGWNYELKN
jgi:hypothetical protein